MSDGLLMETQVAWDARCFSDNVPPFFPRATLSLDGIDPRAWRCNVEVIADGVPIILSDSGVGQTVTLHDSAVDTNGSCVCLGDSAKEFFHFISGDVP